MCRRTGDAKLTRKTSEGGDAAEGEVWRAAVLAHPLLGFLIGLLRVTVSQRGGGEGEEDGKSEHGVRGTRAGVEATGSSTVGVWKRWEPAWDLRAVGRGSRGVGRGKGRRE
jgi:hypothetical protein